MCLYFGLSISDELYFNIEMMIIILRLVAKGSFSFQEKQKQSTILNGQNMTVGGMHDLLCGEAYSSVTAVT